MIIVQMPIFKKKYKKLHKNEKKIIDDEIREILKNPKIGEEKKNDLTAVYVHKFKFNTKEILLAYEFNPRQLILLYFGVHENFYRDLKRQK